MTISKSRKHCLKLNVNINIRRRKNNWKWTLLEKKKRKKRSMMSKTMKNNLLKMKWISMFSKE
jgi:hypothetical protein